MATPVRFKPSASKADISPAPNLIAAASFAGGVPESLN